MMDTERHWVSLVYGMLLWRMGWFSIERDEDEKKSQNIKETYNGNFFTYDGNVRTSKV
jgi:hypothetical protein